MSILTKTLISLSLISSMASADVFHRDFNDEFEKMQHFLNTMINADFKAHYLNISYPKMDMEETKNSYILSFNLAGIDKKDIKLTLNDANILTLEGEKKVEQEDKNKTFMKQEIFYGKFQRSIKLPQNTNPSSLKTEYKNGILKVTINKKVLDTNHIKVIPIN